MCDLTFCGYFSADIPDGVDLSEKRCAEQNRRRMQTNCGKRWLSQKKIVSLHYNIYIEEKK